VPTPERGIQAADVLSTSRNGGGRSSAGTLCRAAAWPVVITRRAVGPTAQPVVKAGSSSGRPQEAVTSSRSSTASAMHTTSAANTSDSTVSVRSINRPGEDGVPITVSSRISRAVSR
jgi:hypothetical protein